VRLIVFQTREDILTTKYNATTEMFVVMNGF
jgi:hypothetical protein